MRKQFYLNRRFNGRTSNPIDGVLKSFFENINYMARVNNTFFHEKNLNGESLTIRSFGNYGCYTLKESEFELIRITKKGYTILISNELINYLRKNPSKQTTIFDIIEHFSNESIIVDTVSNDVDLRKSHFTFNNIIFNKPFKIEIENEELAKRFQLIQSNKLITEKIDLIKKIKEDFLLEFNKTFESEFDIDKSINDILNKKVITINI